jgi:anti-sigma factor RsiW
MNHEEIKARLNEFLDNELPARERAEVLRHVAACPDCGREVTDYKKAAARLFAAPSVSERPAFATRVMARLREREEHSPLAFLFQWKTAFALSALLALWVSFGGELFRSEASWDTALASAAETESWLAAEPDRTKGEWSQWIFEHPTQSEVSHEI